MPVPAQLLPLTGSSDASAVQGPLRFQMMLPREGAELLGCTPSCPHR